MTFSRDIVCEIIKFEHKTCKLTTNLWLCLLFMNIHYLIPKFDWLITDTPGTPPPSSIIAHIPFHPFHNISFSGINIAWSPSLISKIYSSSSSSSSSSSMHTLKKGGHHGKENITTVNSYITYA